MSWQEFLPSGGLLVDVYVYVLGCTAWPREKLTTRGGDSQTRKRKATKISHGDDSSRDDDEASEGSFTLDQQQDRSSAAGGITVLLFLYGVGPPSS